MIGTKDKQKFLLYKGNTFIKSTIDGCIIRVANKEYRIKETMVPYDLLVLVINCLNKPKQIQSIYSEVGLRNFQPQEIQHAIILLIKINSITFTTSNYEDKNIFKYVVKNYVHHEEVLESFFQNRVKVIQDSITEYQCTSVNEKMEFFYNSTDENSNSNNYLQVINSVQDLYTIADLHFNRIILITTFLESNIVTIIHNTEELANIIDILSNREQTKNQSNNLLFNIMLNYAFIILIDLFSHEAIFHNTFLFQQDLTIRNISIQHIDTKDKAFTRKLKDIPSVKKNEAIDRFIAKAKELYDIPFTIDFAKTELKENQVTTEIIDGGRVVSGVANRKTLIHAIEDSLYAVIQGYFNNDVGIAFGKEQLHNQIIQYCIENEFYEISSEIPLLSEGDTKVSLINHCFFKIERFSGMSPKVVYQLTVNSEMNNYKIQNYKKYRNTNENMDETFERILRESNIFLTFWEDKDYFYNEGTFIYRVNSYV